MSINESLDSYFADGTPATWAPSTGGIAQTANVYFDAPDIINSLGDIQMQTGDKVMSYASSAFVGLCEGEAVTVAGVAYRVRSDPMAIGDGAVMQAKLGLYD